MKNQTLSNFFKDAGFDYRQMETNKFYPLDENWEILTRDTSGQNCWRKVTHLVRKETTVPIVVSFLDKELFVSPEHKFLANVAGVTAWIEAIDLLEEEDVFLYHETEEWVTAIFTPGSEEIDILDMSVADVESYYSEGLLSHNTMYGDPTTVPGGMAIPFHASVRIKLGAGQPIKNKNDEPIGINVSAKTIKNKVSAPFRTCNFEIHFGVGIKEHEQLFDVLRQAGAKSINGKTISVEGTGAWKTLLVVDDTTGEVEVEKKFYKADFDKVLSDPDYSSYLEDLTEAVHVRSSLGAADIDVDTESYEEVKAVAQEMEESLSLEGL